MLDQEIRRQQPQQIHQPVPTELQRPQPKKDRIDLGEGEGNPQRRDEIVQNGYPIESRDASPDQNNVRSHPREELPVFQGMTALVSEGEVESAAQDDSPLSICLRG